METRFQESESFSRISFSSGTGAHRGQQRDSIEALPELSDDETTCVSTLSALMFISGFFIFLFCFLVKRLSVFSFSHSAYLPENTWIHAVTVEFNGLWMNLRDNGISIQMHGVFKFRAHEHYFNLHLTPISLKYYAFICLHRWNMFQIFMQQTHKQHLQIQIHTYLMA